MMKTILITGGSGLIGTQLTKILLDRGYTVTHLSRNKHRKSAVKVYNWDITAQKMEAQAIATADVIVHLAGANVADKRWTVRQKQLIVDSRIKSTALLQAYLQNTAHQVKTFIGASATGYYGNGGEAIFTETSSPVSSDTPNFLSETVKKWEVSSHEIAKMEIRSVLLRIGIVLGAEGGALPKTSLPIKFGFPTYFGTGKQFYSWIHIEDLCRMLLYAIEKEEMKGIYNAVAPNPVTNKALVLQIAKTLKRPTWSFAAPEFLLRFALGEMADVVLHGVNVSSKKIEEAGFKFQYPEIKTALAQIYK